MSHFIEMIYLNCPPEGCPHTQKLGDTARHVYHFTLIRFVTLFRSYSYGGIAEKTFARMAFKLQID